MEKDIKTLIESPNPIKENDLVSLYLSLREKTDALTSMITIVSEYVADLLNQIIRNTFVPQMIEMLQKKGLELEGPKPDYNWVQSSYAGFNIINKNWKNFDIRIEFEIRWLKSPIIGFHKKDHFERSEHEEMWNLMQTLLKGKDENNRDWIYKSFIGAKDWHTDQAVEEIVNTNMVQQFEKMIKELLDVAEIIKKEGYEL